MTTIQLIGNVVNKRATFRQELKTLASEWEQNYTFDYMCLNEGYIQIICKFKKGNENRNYLFLDADIILRYLEQWTEWKTSSISFY